ncbi:50S ribosomal protein L11 [Mycoplasma suis]|uniref:Large ribosomal subunit protein uL11 n=2 Tax=Mycoplasma suis TaxID=57372 RepID=F0QQR7_MYCSL|nr:50S ribosomal protein L11 [Mycoplasma suis]ADX97837.1 50S ribosomal protein L11 [Mycoplasma suis str. Illinois]CBZ40336.1 50S ribosomal protein L11 [Mycoplasma suis KI3806]
MFFKTRNRIAKLELVGGQAKPGPALASLGINMVQFSKEFNEKTDDRKGERVPVEIEILPSKAFKFKVKTTPTAVLLKKAAQIEKGASNPGKEVVKTLTLAQVEEIAKYKLVDSNATSIESMVAMIEGTAKQMGIKISRE